ncbi:MAG: hypothetical protein EPN37_03330 [Chitinophagaceae bacterium]|nr:MAG: hypothetical protein EPN37_03330 [Chitinophagaceae bacterium]
METYSQDISNALQQHGQCVLPNIGLLYIVRNPASRSYQDNKIYPPASEISLIPLSEQDHTYRYYSIIRQIAFSHSLSEEEAELKWNEAASAIRKKLSTGSSVELPGIGLLNLDNDREITLDAEQSFTSSIYQPVSLDEIKSFSLQKSESVTAPAETIDAPVNEQVQPPENILPPLQKKKRHREMASWWITGTIMTLLLVGWLTYKGTLKRNKITEAVKNIIARDTTNQTAKKDSMKLKEDTVAQENVIQRDSIHYTIVFAIYNNKEKAMHQYHKIKGWGHPVVLLTKDSSTYELGRPFTTLPPDTTVSLVSMMKLYGDKVHIEYDNSNTK